MTSPGAPAPPSAALSGLAPNGKPYVNWRVGYPLGHSIPSRTDAATEALYDYSHRVNLGKVPWASHCRYIGSVRVESIRIDDNRNNLCRMFLDREDGQVLVQLDRDEIVPPDGVLQLVTTTTPPIKGGTPVVCGIYFQRSLDNPYPHVYRHSHEAPNQWKEPSRHSHRLVEDVYRRLVRLGIPEAVASNEIAFRLAAPDGSPLPEAVRLLKGGAFGGTGFFTVHADLLRLMEQRGAPYFPWFREKGEKGDMAFFNNVVALGKELDFEIAVDCTVFAGHIAEEVIGLKHFWQVYGPAVRLADAVRQPKMIKTVAIAMATIDPVNAVKVIEQVKETSGLPAKSLVFVLVDDAARRFGTRTLNDAITGALNVKSDAVLLLDDDISFPQHGWLRKLCDALEAPGVGAVGPSLECRGNQARPVDDFRAAGGNTDDMPFLCGAVMLYGRDALMAAGALDESLAHYHSDTFHSITMKSGGWKLVWVPDVRVHHEIAGAGFYPELWNSDAARFNALVGPASGIQLSQAAIPAGQSGAIPAGHGSGSADGAPTSQVLLAPAAASASAEVVAGTDIESGHVGISLFGAPI